MADLDNLSWNDSQDFLKGSVLSIADSSKDKSSREKEVDRAVKDIGEGGRRKEPGKYKNSKQYQILTL